MRGRRVGVFFFVCFSLISVVTIHCPLSGIVKAEWKIHKIPEADVNAAGI